MKPSWKITPKVQEELKNNLNIHFQIIYKGILDQNEILKLINRVLDLFQNKDLGISEPNWSQKDVFLITYGDSIYEEKNNKLKTLSKFLDKYCKKQFNNLHILPFFPYSSDDGFSITDYEEVRSDLGDWKDIKSLSKKSRRSGIPYFSIASLSIPIPNAKPVTSCSTPDILKTSG